MKYYRVFQVLLMIAMVIVAIFEVKESIVHDRASRWTLPMALALFAMVFGENYLQKKSQRKGSDELPG